MSGIVGGTVIAGLDLNPSFKTMLVFCIALYLLSIVLLFMLRIRKRSEREQRPAASGEPVRSEDAFDAKGTEVTVRHGLTDRESEILLLLARGRSSTYIVRAGGARAGREHGENPHVPHLREAGRTLQAGDNRSVHRLTFTKMS